MESIPLLFDVKTWKKDILLNSWTNGKAPLYDFWSRSRGEISLLIDRTNDEDNISNMEQGERI